MLHRSSSPSHRALWITLGALAVAAVVGTAIAVVRHDAHSSRTTDNAVAQSTAASSNQPAVSPVASPVRPMLPGSAPDDSRLVGGMTNHLDFTRAVAGVLLAYDSSTDFPTRNADLLRAAAPPPYGDPTGLTDDLIRFTPSGAALESLHAAGSEVTVELSEVTVSGWAERRLDEIGVSAGVHGVDVTGVQTITTRDTPPVSIPVELGVIVVCPPTVSFCTLERIYPQHLQNALAAG